MIKCGVCKTSGVTIDHVRACSSQPKAQVSVLSGQYAKPINPPVKPAAKPAEWQAWKTVPEGRYALRQADGKVHFYRVKDGRVPGYKFLDAQASDELWAIKSFPRKVEVMTAIAKDIEAARKLYAAELGRCYRCGRTLTDELSRELGIGPDCRSK